MTKTKKRPTPPEDIDGEALLEWQRICDELDVQEGIDAEYRAVLILYVNTWAEYQKATRGVNQYGSVIKYSNGMVGPSPYYKIQREKAIELRGLLNDLGLTPAARGKGKGKDATSATSELEF